MTLEKARTISVASKFGGDLAGRWRNVRGLIRKTVDQNDALGVGDSAGIETLARPRERFDFPTDAQKQQAFERWLSGAIDDEFFEPVGDVEVRRGRHYSAKYVRSANRGGLRDAGTRLREAGIEPQFSRDELEDLFNLPVNTETLESLYVRSFRELENVSRDVGQRIGRVLADGFAQGLNPRDIASEMNGEIDSVGLRRARTIARTETARAYSVASETRYQRNGIQRVNVVNPNPCARICAPIIADNPYPVDGSGAIVPAHPNCRCAISPIASSIGGSS